MRYNYSKIENKVNLYVRLERFDAAEKLIRAALQESPELANLHNLLGVIFHKQSRFLEAVEQFSRAFYLNTKFIEAGLNLSATLCDLSRYDEARKIYAEIQNKTSANKKQPELILGRLANTHVQVGKLYEQCNMLAEAIQEYRKALNLYENMPDVKLALAHCYQKNNQLEKAQLELEYLTKTQPNAVEPYNLLGVLYWKLGKKEQARGQWLKVQQLNPNDSYSRAYLHITEQLMTPSTI